jgi:DedD protein
MTAPEDLNVDELRRRARRRLVGAIVLALAVAVLVPLLLESDPKPLGEDVSVKIPPIDEGKFVNRLNEKTKTEPPKTAIPKSSPSVEAKSEPPKADPPKAEPPKAEPKVEEAPKVEVAKAEPKSEPAKSEPAPAAPASREPVAGDFAVQVFAFSDDKGANSLVNKLKKAGYPAYTEPVNTGNRTLWRVRLGPYASRESAGAARDKLKGEGYNGIVTAAK